MFLVYNQVYSMLGEKFVEFRFEIWYDSLVGFFRIFMLNRKVASRIFDVGKASGIESAFSNNNVPFPLASLWGISPLLPSISTTCSRLR
jgi:hypothetical protein